MAHPLLERRETETLCPVRLGIPGLDHSQLRLHQGLAEVCPQNRRRDSGCGHSRGQRGRSQPREVRRLPCLLGRTLREAEVCGQDLGTQVEFARHLGGRTQGAAESSTLTSSHEVLGVYCPVMQMTGYSAQWRREGRRPSSCRDQKKQVF